MPLWCSKMNDTSIVLISWCPNDYRLKVLRQSLESLRAHTKRPHTLVVVDNGPQEQTHLIHEYNPDIHLINPVNRNVGPSRNQGAAATDSKYIAFVDNDIGYFPGWLDATIGVLEEYPDRRLVASAVKNHPMKLAKNRAGKLDHYDIYRRCAGMAMVMRRSTYDEAGGFHETKTNVGHQWCMAMKRHGYLFIHDPAWRGRHIARKASYHYKKQQFVPETGQWVNKQESMK